MVNTLKNKVDVSTSQRGGCESNTAFLLQLLRMALPNAPLAIGVSGGLDSMAMLHATIEVMRKTGSSLTVFHVHHDLHQEADNWLSHVADFCAVQSIPFFTHRLDARTRRSAQSIEDWARQGRYQALKQMADEQNIKHIWLAHHQDDQVETHLLQKARGAGVRGLSAMPHAMKKLGLTWQRPWLLASREQLALYVQEHQIEHIHDSSNDDPRFARNALRIELTQQKHQERARVLRDIDMAQQQQAIEQAWANKVLQNHMTSHRADIGEVGRLHDLNLSIYEPEQQALLLRAWFDSMAQRMPTRAGLNELLMQLTNTRADQQMCWRHPDGWAVARFKNEIIAAHIQPTEQWCLSDELQQWINEEGLTIRHRQGGERIRLAKNRSAISLKEAYGHARIAPMLRAQLPLLYRGDELIYVVGVGLVY